MTASVLLTPADVVLAAPVELVVLDMAGTTVRDDGIVERAFARTAERTGVAAALSDDEALDYVRRTMGMSKLNVFRHLSGGDEDAAARAAEAFEQAYAELVGEEGAEAIEGAEQMLRDLRAAGLSVALTTGFAPATRDAILDALGWHELVDVALSPIDAGRGRPAPDLVLTALLRTGASSVQSVVVVGDTTSDVASGRRAGAGLVVGVLSGAHDRAALEAAAPDLIVEDVTALGSIRGLWARS